jgi:hypothetical protein
VRQASGDAADNSRHTKRLHYPGVVALQFKDRLDVRLNAVGLATTADQDATLGFPREHAEFTGLPSSEAAKLFEIFQRYAVRRIRSNLTNEQRDYLRKKIELHTGRLAPHVVRFWYYITLPSEADTEGFMAALKQLDSVGIVEPVPVVGLP